MDNVYKPEDISWFREAKESFLLDLITDFMFLWKTAETENEKIDQQSFINEIMALKARARTYGIIPSRINNAILDGGRKFDRYQGEKHNG